MIKTISAVLLFGALVDVMGALAWIASGQVPPADMYFIGKGTQVVLLAIIG